MLIKRTLVDRIRRGSAVIRAPRLLKKLAGGLRAVLYHHLGEPCLFTRRIGVCTPPELFEAHIECLVCDYDIMSLDDVLDGTLPKRPLLITFDDAYRSALDVGAPIFLRGTLRRMCTTAVLFERCYSSCSLYLASRPQMRLFCLWRLSQSTSQRPLRILLRNKQQTCASGAVRQDSSSGRAA